MDNPETVQIFFETLRNRLFPGSREDDMPEKRGHFIPSAFRPDSRNLLMHSTASEHQLPLGRTRKNRYLTSSTSLPLFLAPVYPRTVPLCEGNVMVPDENDTKLFSQPL